MYHIEIKDNLNQGFLSITLLDLLKKLNVQIRKYEWSIYELSAISKKDSNLDIIALEERVAKSSVGFHCNAKALLNLAEKLEQVKELILVASVNGENFSEFKNNSKWRSKFSIVIQIVDGSFWEVYSNDQTIINLFKF